MIIRGKDVYSALTIKEGSTGHTLIAHIVSHDITTHTVPSNTVSTLLVERDNAEPLLIPVKADQIRYYDTTNGITDNDYIFNIDKPFVETATLSESVSIHVDIEPFSDTTSGFTESHFFEIGQVINETKNTSETVNKHITTSFSESVSVSESFDALQTVYSDETQYLYEKLTKDIGLGITGENYFAEDYVDPSYSAYYVQTYETVDKHVTTSFVELPYALEDYFAEVYVLPFIKVTETIYKQFDKPFNDALNVTETGAIELNSTPTGIF